MTEKLTFERYEKTVVETEIYHDSIQRYVDSLQIPDQGNREHLHTLLCRLYCVLGLLGEAGEIAEKMKKVIRDKDCDINQQDRELLLKEEGDVLWYGGALAKELQSNFENVALINIEKLLSRKQRGVISGSGDNR